MTTVNCNDPCQDFCPTQEQLCLIEHIKNTLIPDMSVLNALVDGIDDYECNTDTVYQCKDIILFKGGFYESLKNDNDRHPHDDNAWKEHGTLKDIFSTLSQFQNVSNIAIPYHNSCNMSAVCKPFYMTGDLVAVSIDTGEVDSCANAIFEDMYYISTADNNMETPAEDAANWTGPMSVEELLAGGAMTPDTICNALTLVPEEGCS